MLTKEQKKSIIQLHSEGLTIYETSKEINLDKDTVRSYLKKLKLPRNIPTNHHQFVDIIDDTSARCLNCKEIKHLKEFQYERKDKQYEYKFSCCEKCRENIRYLKNYTKKNNDEELFLKYKYNGLINRAKHFNITVDITFEDFYGQFLNQGGKCFYTDKKMVMEVGNKKNRWAISIDKIIPENGYINGNIVFCGNKINTVKSNFSLEEIKLYMPDWYRRIKKKFSNDINN